MKLRPYQSQALDAIADQFADGRRSTLLVMATGLGKTVTFVHAIERFAPTGRVMILAHLDELIGQAAKAVRKIRDEDPGIEMAERVADGGGLFARKPKVVVSSIQTQDSTRYGKKRFEKFNPEDFDLVIVDEAHHAASPQYRRVVEHYMRNERTLFLGVTATPDRFDKKDSWFESVAFKYGIEEGRDNSWLVPFRYKMLRVKSLKFGDVKVRAGDFVDADLGRAVTEEGPLHEIVDGVMDVALGRGIPSRGRPGIVFTPTVMSAKLMCEVANRSRYGRSGLAAYVDGSMDKALRRQIVDRFNRRDIHVLFNCQVFTEGFDAPRVGFVAIARPTMSLSRYVQMIGRGTRPLPGLVDGHHDDAEARRAAIACSHKPNLLVMDFVGAGMKHSLVTLCNIFGGTAKPEVIADANQMAQDAEEPADPEELIEKAEDAARKRQEAEELRQAELDRVRKRRHILAKVKYDVSDHDPFARFGVRGPLLKRSEGDGAPLAADVLYLEKHKIPTEGLSATQANDLVKRIKQRIAAGYATPRQVACLKKFGVDATDWKRERAGMELGRRFGPRRSKAVAGGVT